MAKGWASVHPEMETALKAIGVKESQVLLGYDDGPSFKDKYHLPEGEIDGHPYSCCVDLPLRLASKELQSQLIAAGFAPFMNYMYTPREHIHAVYIGARDERGVLTMLPSVRIRLFDWLEVPLIRPLTSHFRPTDEEHRAVIDRYYGQMPDPHTRVVSPDGRLLATMAFCEPDRPGVVRCRPTSFGADFWIGGLGRHLWVQWPDGFEIYDECPPELRLRYIHYEEYRVDAVALATLLGYSVSQHVEADGSQVLVVSGPGHYPRPAPKPARTRVEPKAPAVPAVLPAPPPPNLEFEQTFAAAVAAHFRRLRPADRVPAAEVEEAEQRLGMRLPRQLRSLYRISGRFDDLHTAFDSLVAPKDLDVQGDFLVFYCENQNVVCWAVKTSECGNDDPPVYEGTGEEGSAWHPHTPRLSAFLVSKVYEQAVNGGARHLATAEVTAEVERRVAAQWPLVSDCGGPESGRRIYAAELGTIAFEETEPTCRLVAAARTRKAIAEIARLFGVGWEDL